MRDQFDRCGIPAISGAMHFDDGNVIAYEGGDESANRRANT